MKLYAATMSLGWDEDTITFVGFGATPEESITVTKAQALKVRPWDKKNIEEYVLWPQEVEPGVVLEG